ncbi:hypothetical protein ACLOJK_017158 [Asimina triloba]
MVRKASMGRQKIEIKRIENEDARQVCFSKRRAGLFKKASELCILCGAEIAIIVFSPAGKVFSFGHPGVDSLIERVMPNAVGPSPASAADDATHRGAVTRELNRQCADLMAQVEVEKKRKVSLEELLSLARTQSWWDAPIEQLGLIELEQLRGSMEDLKMRVGRRADDLLVQSVAGDAVLSMNNSIGTSIDPFGKVEGQRAPALPQQGFGFNGTNREQLVRDHVPQDVGTFSLVAGGQKA